MKPKEKAEMLVDEYYQLLGEYIFNGHFDIAKECALIAIDEIIDLNLGLSNCDEENWAIEKFYTEVKQEIERL
jgi:hypothetical protein